MFELKYRPFYSNTGTIFCVISYHINSTQTITSLNEYFKLFNYKLNLYTTHCEILGRGIFNARFFLLFPLQAYVLVVGGGPAAVDEEYPTKQLMNTVPVVKLTYVSVMVRNDPKNNFALSNSLLSVFPSSDVVASCSVCMMSLLDALFTAELTVVANQKSVILVMGNNWNKIADFSQVN